MEICKIYMSFENFSLSVVIIHAGKCVVIFVKMNRDCAIRTIFLDS